MKRVGVLTFHRSVNYGAVLQSFSLINKLKKDFPEHSFEIIDYFTKAEEIQKKKGVLSAIKHGSLSDGWTAHKKNKVFKAFSNTLPQSEKHIVSDSLVELEKYLNENYDIVISGSDAVFNWNYKKFPTAYLLGGDANYKKVSYAASAHRLFYKEIEQAKVDYCKNAFEQYSYIGVRDPETERFVKFCNNDVTVHRNCDPTFVIDLEYIKSQCLEFDFKKTFKLTDDKPVIIVMSPDAKLGRQVVDSFGKTHNIVSVFIRNKAINNHCNTLTPFEWACCFSYADLTVTEYFHGTIFSLLNKTPTVTVDRLGYSKGYEGKIHNLLCNDLKLNDFYINQDELDNSGYGLISEKAVQVLKGSYGDKIELAVKTEREKYSEFKFKFDELLQSF